MIDIVSRRRNNAFMAIFEASVFDRRHALWYVTAWLAGLLLVLTAMSPRLTGFGLGLMVPGGGLAFYGHWTEAVVSLAGVGCLLLTRRTAPAMFAWVVVAAAPLTHEPHHGYVWTASQWIVPVLSATVAIVAALAARATRRRGHAWAAAGPR
jgi:hypothetical protein